MTGDGGKWVCGVERLLAKPDCVIYSFGVEQASSFEAALLRRSSGCRLFAFDSSVVQVSVAYLSGIAS